MILKGQTDYPGQLSRKFQGNFSSFPKNNLKLYYFSSNNFLFKRFNLLKVHVRNLCSPSSESSEGLSREVKLTFFRGIKRKSNLTDNKFDFCLQKSANSNESRESTILNFPRFSMSTFLNIENRGKLRIVDIENRGKLRIVVSPNFTC